VPSGPILAPELQGFPVQSSFPGWLPTPLPSSITWATPAPAEIPAAEEPKHDGHRRARTDDHARTWELRETYIQIAEALEGAEIFSKLFRCGVKWSRCSSCHKDHFDPRKCGSRLCPFDARRLARERVDLYMDLVTRMRSARFLTFTRPLIPYTASLKDGLRKIRRAFNRLLRAKVFGAVKGGVYSIEIVLRPGGFHVHLHVLLDAVWIENRNEEGRPLETAWKRCLEREGVEMGELRAVVDVRKADRETIKEVLKYTVKGAKAKKDEPPAAGGAPSIVHTGRKTRTPALAWAEVPAEGLKQLVDVVEGRTHLVEPFGSFRGALGKFRERVKAEARARSQEKDAVCDCGGELVAMGTLQWRDRRLFFVAGRITFIPPPDVQGGLDIRIDLRRRRARA
jgi:hypothetical protein